MRLHSPYCPRCGAKVELDTARQRATCAYCGTTSYAAGAASGAGLPVVVIKTHVVTALALGVSLLALLIAAIVLTREARAPAVAPRAVPPPIPRVPDRAPEARHAGPAAVPLTTLRVTGSLPARLADVDGEGRPELVLSVRAEEPSGRRETQVAVFNLVTGELRARTPALEDDLTLAALWGARLVVAQRTGQLTAYGLVSGHAQWTSALGERVAALCEPTAGAPHSLHVTTDDGRELQVELTSGRQRETKAHCQVPLAIAEGRKSPRDRRDPSAPTGVRAYLCGGVRVLSEGYAIPDACRVQAAIPSDRLPGMVGHRIWAYQAGFLVFGVRSPGTYVPMVGRYQRGRFRWQLQVPREDPLEVDEGGPAHVDLADNDLAIAYTSSKARRSYVTLLDAEDGRRIWTADLGEGSRPLVALRMGPDTVVAHSETDVALLDRQSGKVRMRLSELRLPAR